MDTTKVKTFLGKAWSATKEFGKTTASEIADVASKAPGVVKSHPRATAAGAGAMLLTGWGLYKAGKAKGKKKATKK